MSTKAFNDPKISVVIPVHNGARWLGETLQSLYAQSEPDFEIVVVDDASTDHLHDVLNQNADSRLRVVHLNPNLSIWHVDVTSLFVMQTIFADSSALRCSWTFWSTIQR